MLLRRYWLRPGNEILAPSPRPSGLGERRPQLRLIWVPSSLAQLRVHLVLCPLSKPCTVRAQALHQVSQLFELRTSIHVVVWIHLLQVQPDCLMQSFPSRPQLISSSEASAAGLLGSIGELFAPYTWLSSRAHAHEPSTALFGSPHVVALSAWRGRVPCASCETGDGFIIQGDHIEGDEHQRVEPAEDGGLFCAKCFVARLRAKTN